MSIIDDIFQPLYGKPCWEVTQGYGSFLTFEFGEPHLHIREPREATKGATEKVRRNAARRFIYVHGDWHLWVYLCDWRILLNSEELANQDARRNVIKKAILEIDGQALLQVVVRKNLATTLDFDLGGRLEIIPNPKKYKPVKEYKTAAELWHLYGPSDEVFTLRGDGQYSRMPGDTPYGDEIWQPLSM